MPMQSLQTIVRRFSVPIVVMWLVALAVGFAIAIDFDARPGAASSGDRAWPRQTKLRRAAHGTTLVMFLHPECPCSQASLEELAPVLAASGAESTAHIVIVGAGPEGPASSNVERAKNVAGASVCFDTDGDEARRFGSHTSGDVFIFDANGHSTFAGGITAGRGHQGDNLAAAAAKAAAAGTAAGATQMPVFGCALFGRDD
jgi:hypothetical protein